MPPGGCREAVAGTRRGQDAGTAAGQRQEPSLSMDIEANLLHIHGPIDGHPQGVPDLSTVL